MTVRKRRLLKNSALHCLLSEAEFVFHTVILSEVEFVFHTVILSEVEFVFHTVILSEVEGSVKMNQNGKR